MPPFGPIQRQDLIRNFKKVGFEGPYSGGKHQYMIQGQLKVWIPNPHQGDIGKSLLARILTQANITREEWESL
ncbi:type II toxin-antitoxin system HicA family toxin [Laspinema sp. D1]|uniref:type II toxin-antitoxin system HicA family toxin n=1 Tax=Laspinema palackyanum TaxID=3231601 RepID=UPI00347A365C|nr:type II toxin-antitoxin system HicA family toxin [Laspinema sp. D2b]